jgi:hypothetical protein
VGQVGFEGATGSDRSSVRPTDRVVAAFFCIAAAASIIGARATVVALPTLLIMVLALARVERAPLRMLVKPVPEALPIAALLMFGMLSAAWSADAGATLASAATAAFSLFAWLVIHRWLCEQPGGRVRHTAIWFVIAVLVGGGVLLTELFSDQFIRRAIVDAFGLMPTAPNRHYWLDAGGRVRVPDWDLNRSVAVANMLLWPAVLCALSCWAGWTRRSLAFLLIACTAVATGVSNHETSKLAIVAGLLCFGLASLRPRVAIGLAALVWTVAVLGSVPAARIAHDPLALHEASWLQETARARILIWSKVADRVTDAPIIGSGVRSGQVLYDRRKLAQTHSADTSSETAVPRHAHNVYLQMWFELGLIGAALFLAAGLAVLRALARMSERAQPFALATFAVFMAEILSSWEVWQGWFVALFALTPVYLALAVRNAEGWQRQDPADDAAL